LGGLAIAFDLREVADIIVGECVVGIEGVGFEEVLFRGFGFVAVKAETPRVFNSAMRTSSVIAILQAVFADCGHSGGHLSDGFSSPRAVERDHGCGIGIDGGRGIVVAQRFLRFAFHLFCDSHVIEGENIVGIGFESFLQQKIGLGPTSLRKQAYGFYVVVVDL